MLQSAIFLIPKIAEAKTVRAIGVPMIVCTIVGPAAINMNATVNEKIQTKNRNTQPRIARNSLAEFIMLQSDT